MATTMTYPIWLQEVKFRLYPLIAKNLNLDMMQRYWRECYTVPEMVKVIMETPAEQSNLTEGE